MKVTHNEVQELQQDLFSVEEKYQIRPAEDFLRYISCGELFCLLLRNTNKKIEFKTFKSRFERSEYLKEVLNSVNNEFKMNLTLEDIENLSFDSINIKRVVGSLKIIHRILKSRQENKKKEFINSSINSEDFVDNFAKIGDDCIINSEEILKEKKTDQTTLSTNLDNSLSSSLITSDLSKEICSNFLLSSSTILEKNIFLRKFKIQLDIVLKWTNGIINSTPFLAKKEEKDKYILEYENIPHILSDFNIFYFIVFNKNISLMGYYNFIEKPLKKKQKIILKTLNDSGIKVNKQSLISIWLGLYNYKNKSPIRSEEFEKNFYKNFDNPEETDLKLKDIVGVKDSERYKITFEKEDIDTKGEFNKIDEIFLEIKKLKDENILLKKQIKDLKMNEEILKTQFFKIYSNESKKITNESNSWHFCC